MFDTWIGTFSSVVDAAISILGLEAIVILMGFGGLIGVLLGIKAVKMVKGD